ncbi:DUF2269 domain-containing protein [Heyndrickxia sporothermodurans]|uniref:DUF2269 family protein n=1 Tax=Heyndrickxia sp. FSL W8-0423 TaxID=2921601 RepID=UPI000A00A9ED|nr:DUF2269 family protein [Heyndrickxia sporothermodurans]MEB6548457.1 DUF2269 domain-containing protein [Heyndrickxia sporothermodurans]MED3651789.1 DUF2269 family protein [Heyndrickxia sporothermodurans]MED3654753.1 DUF2269 family protein [Heyndrickxia sporothermodurans]MED3697124.1 DUF2269 family protein [Heyndrickxia sporothermodurans]MED3781716.1 DUF2269 family protein [Heyndrickxia sporothermodurans]
MVLIYKILVFIHIFSAILGMGPGFILTRIGKSADTMTKVRHSFAIRRDLHIIVMIGGTLLLVTGLLMGMLNPNLFRMGWYIASLILFLIGLAMGPFVLSPRSKPIKELLASYEGEEIPEQYTRLSKELFRYENLENLIFLIIIALMILKPF